MARISTYAIDTVVQLLDKWIGTDSNGGTTKNFTAQSIADLFNEHGSIGILGQNNFFFQTDLIGGRKAGSISFEFGGGNNTAFSALTTIKVSKFSAADKLILQYLQSLVGEYIMLAQVDDLNNFGVYRLDSLIQDTIETDFYDANFTLVKHNGSLVSEEYYGIAAVPVPVSQSGDKHFTYTRLSASNTWTITHNLDKFPSVSVVDSGNNVVIGDIQYTNTNELTITFNASFSGKAYLN
jgi:hypothetical protein